MADFATFEPIKSELREGLIEYYKNNNISIPDIPHFRSTFKITEDKVKPEKADISKPQSIFANVKIPAVTNKKDTVKKEEIPTFDNPIKQEIHSLNITEEDKDFLNILGEKESAFNPTAENRFGFFGLYQFGDAALRDTGYTREDFKDTVNQHRAALKLAELNEGRLRDIVDKYVGKEFKGINITRNGIRAAAHLLGAQTVRDWFSGTKFSPFAKRGFKDAFGTSITDYLKAYA